MQIEKRKVVAIGIDLSVLILLVGISLIVITRFTGKAIPLVEEWSIYRRNIQFDAFIQTVVLQKEPQDIRYVFDSGMMSFLPINWLSQIFRLFDTVLLEIRFNMAINIAVIGYSGYLLLKFVGCNFYFSVLGAVSLQGAFFSFVSYSSTPRYLTIPLFTGCFLLNAHSSLSTTQFVMRTMFLFAAFITMASNAACLVVALSGVPIGAMYALILQDHFSRREIFTRMKRIWFSSMLAAIVFGPFLFIEFRRANSNNLLIFTDQPFEIKRFLNSLLGRGFWWEYGYDNSVRYTPYVDAFDDVYVVLARTCMLLVPILFVRNFIYNSKFIKSRSSESIKNPFELANKVVFFMVIAGIFALFSNLNSMPGWSYVASRLQFLGIFREAFSKFNGVYVFMALVACFIALQNYSLSAWRATSAIRFWRNAHGYILSLMLVSMSMCYVAKDDFASPINKPTSLSISDYLSLKRLGALLDNSPGKHTPFCILYEGNGELTWAQSSVTRLMMSQIKRQSRDWKLSSTSIPAQITPCKSDFITISKDGIINVTMRT
jgi:hypothetical protein